MALLGDDTGAFLTSERLIRHKYTVITSDQQELLGCPDAWNTKGIPNVPPQVLEDVKKTFARRMRTAAGSAQATPVSRHPGGLNGSSRQNHHGRSERAADNDMKDGKDHEHSDDDDGEPIPWSPSPTQHKQAPVPHDELPTPRPINLRVRSSSPLHSHNIHPPSSSPARRNDLRVPSSPSLPTTRPSPHKVSQTPLKKAAHPAPLASPKTRVVQREPPSSLASEPDLEYQPPRAITDVVTPVDRVLRSTRPPLPEHRVLRSMQPPAPTPPSAQEPVTVPCTWKEPSDPGKDQQTPEEPAKKRRRLMKPPQFESSQAVDPDSAAAPSSSRGAPVRLGGSQTTNSSSASSVIARTPRKRYPDPHLGRGPKVLFEGELFAVFKPPTQVIQPGEEGYDDSSQLGEAAQNGSFSSSARPPPNGPASQAPFVAFCAAYPNYKGSVRDLVSAAISIQHLQKSRSLPDFLYDDYIRVFAHQYINYMRKCVKERRKPLSAIQWYNENVPGPEYNKRIFTRGNIADITEHHNAEAEYLRHLSRELRGQSDNDSSSLPAAASPTTTVSPTPQAGSEDLRPDGSPTKNDVSSLPAATPPLVATSSLPRSEPEVLPRGGPAPAQSDQPLLTPNFNIHAMLRPDQIEKVEPLRSVPGYVVIMSPSRASASKRAAVSPPEPPEIKDEEDELPSTQLPPFMPNSVPRDSVSAGRAAFDDRNPPPTYSNRSPARILPEQATTRKANTSHMMQASENFTQDTGNKEREPRSDRPSLRPPKSRSPFLDDAMPLASTPPVPFSWGSKAFNPQPKKPPPPRPKSPSPSFGDVLTQPPATAISFVSDFTRSIESIPDTAIKPKDAPRFNHRTHVPRGLSSASKPPAPLAVSSSRNLKEKKLTKADRFRMFVQKRQAQSSAPKSTIED